MNVLKSLNIFRGKRSRIVAEANRLRDTGKFAAAAEKYAEWLRISPDDFRVIVQRGNCLKDSFDFDHAMEAYDRARSLQPRNADVHLQMGHCLKLAGEIERAARCYAKSSLLDGLRPDAGDELKWLGYRAERKGDEVDADGVPLFDLVSTRDVPSPTSMFAEPGQAETGAAFGGPVEVVVKRLKRRLETRRA